MFKKITFKRFVFVPVVMLVIVMVFYLSVYAGGIQDKLINFQGFLTDSANSPLEGTQAITFRIYENAGDQTPIWAEHHSSVTVIKGNVSVLLGSINSMGLAFDQPRYLGIQVGSDPEMTPRQKILPSFQAAAANKLVVTYANQSRGEFGVNNLVPIGGIISYYGDSANLPDNWKVCDGTILSDSESPLNGQTLPNLLGQFVRGAESNDQVGQKGGSDSVDIQHSHGILDSGAHSHSSAGSHNHSVSVGGADLYGSIEQITCPTFAGDQSFPAGVFTHTFSIACNAQGIEVQKGQRHVHSVSTGASGDHFHPASGNHNHGGNTMVSGSSSIDNRPAYTSLYYIIRIK